MSDETLVLFDFDGTITTKDTFVEFIRFNKGFFKFWFGFILLSPLIIGFKLKIIPNWKAKELVFSYFFKGTTLNDFEAMCKAYSLKNLPSIIRPKAIEEIKKHQRNSAVISIVSASPELWIQNWAKEQSIGLIGTKLEVINNTLTGKIQGNNCYGPEKVNRVKTTYNLSDYKYIIAYGDSSGDKEMLAIADEKHYKPFRNP